MLNEVVFTQVCATFGTDQRTQEVVRRMLEDGTAWMTGSTWHEQSVLRISVNHTKVVIGNRIDVVARHTEINEMTAKAIIRKMEGRS